MILTGTAGYSYKDWIGPFYPEGTKDGSMLEYYSGSFDFVEVNSSYYHMPSSRLFEGMAKKTPASFRFAVKLFGGFTHERTSGRTEAEQFMYAVSPVCGKGRLICLLAQFPYSFHYTAENTDYLKRLREWFPDVEINLEFRNQQWIRSEVVGLMRKENLGFVCVDEPRLKGLIGNVAVSTSKVAYVRFHGRNSGKWYGGEGSERYDYLYTSRELEEWVPRIRELEEESPTVVLSFNNHPRGKAVENARAMAELLKEGLCSS